MLSTIGEDIRRFAGQCCELMFNERDFQMQLALFLNQTGHYDDVEVEYYIPNTIAKKADYEWDSNLKLDIVTRLADKYAVIELKYPTRRVVCPIQRFGKAIDNCEIMKNQGAQDLVSYNFWKDVRRIEVVKRLFPDTVVGGLAVMLTNDPYYVKGPSPGSLCEQFSTANNRKKIHGYLDWTRHTKTTIGHPGFKLYGNYSILWNTYEIENNKFYQTLITVT